MKYKLQSLKLVSKFTYHWFESNYNWDISSIFWRYLFDVSNFKKFISEKYIPYKKEAFSGLNSQEYKSFLDDYKLIISKLDLIKSNISFSKNIFPPNWEDIIVSFIVFDKVLFYYRNYYDGIDISLREWLKMKLWYSGVDDFFSKIKLFKQDKLLKDILFPIIDEYILVDKNVPCLYKIKIFWPWELFFATLISNYLKKCNKNSKILIDLSDWNEQFDFIQWEKLIKENHTKFSKYFDFFVMVRDFWTANKNIIECLNKNSGFSSLKNVLYFDKKWPVYKEIDYTPLQEEIFSTFIKNTFDEKYVSTLLWKKFIYARFLPYKCYWDNCNFCAINSQNKYTYNNKYSYDYFIEKWLKFIVETNLYYIHFIDEAIPPQVIVKFAKEIIKRKIKINYAIRTRFEKAYTKENCIFFAKSWLRFMWMWLESASERVNEQIWNKWNGSVSINEKLKIIHLLDELWVWIHNYSIRWFPWETEDEFTSTYNFLKSNIINSNYFTCSPNIFWLMRWPKIFSEKEKYWIEIEKKELNNPFNLILFDFKVNWEYRNMDLLMKHEQDLHFSQFLSWFTGDKRNFINSRNFWDYVDRSSIFYTMKRLYKKNPYRAYFDCNKEILKKDYKQMLKHNFKFTKYYTFLEDKTGVYNWVFFEKLYVSSKQMNFIKNYDFEINLEKNLEKYDLLWEKYFVLNLLKKLFLVYTEYEN